MLLTLVNDFNSFFNYEKLVKNQPLNTFQRMSQGSCTSTTTSRQANGSTKNQSFTFVFVLGFSSYK